MKPSYYWREALSGMGRAKLMSLLSVSSITVALFLLGTFLLVTTNFMEAVKSLKGKFEIQAFIRDGANDADVRKAQARLKEMPGVAEVAFLSKQAAMEEFRREMAGMSDFLEALENNPLPRSFRIALLPSHQNPQAISELAEKIDRLDIVEETEYGKTWISKLYRVASLLLALDLSLLVIVSAAVLIVVFNTIRLTLYARRQAIEIMRLVGATDAFIRRPFLLEGVIQGGAGSAAGLVLLYFGHRLIASQFGMLRFFSPRETLTLFLFGLLLGALGSWSAAKIFLKRI